MNYYVDNGPCAPWDSGYWSVSEINYTLSKVRSSLWDLNCFSSCSETSQWSLGFVPCPCHVHLPFHIFTMSLALSCFSIHLCSPYNSATTHSSSFDCVSVPLCFLWSADAWHRTSALCLKAGDVVAQTLLARITQEQLYWTVWWWCNFYS